MRCRHKGFLLFTLPIPRRGSFTYTLTRVCCPFTSLVWTCEVEAKTSRGLIPGLFRFFRLSTMLISTVTMCCRMLFIRARCRSCEYIRLSKCPCIEQPRTLFKLKCRFILALTVGNFKIEMLTFFYHHMGVS